MLTIGRRYTQHRLCVDKTLLCMVGFRQYEMLAPTIEDTGVSIVKL